MSSLTRKKSCKVVMVKLRVRSLLLSATGRIIRQALVPAAQHDKKQNKKTARKKAKLSVGEADRRGAGADDSASVGSGMTGASDQYIAASGARDFAVSLEYMQQRTLIKELRSRMQRIKVQKAARTLHSQRNTLPHQR